MWCVRNVALAALAKLIGDIILDLDPRTAVDVHFFVINFKY